jgi:3-deoxy-7-phosphoheptulonate synthase/chorismate mutase
MRNEIEKIREKIYKLNLEILRQLEIRAELVKKIGQMRREKGIRIYDPIRESEMLERLVSKNKRAFSNEAIRVIFKEIFKMSADLQEKDRQDTLLVNKKHETNNTLIKIGNVTFGNGIPIIIAGPCSIESHGQLNEIAKCVSDLGVRILRGGAFKPRTSPYDFQGLREEGLKYLRDISSKYGLLAITEVLDTRYVDLVYNYTDIFQIGSRNMQNFELLKLVGKTDKPVMLKRGFMSTLEEFLFAAEYIMTSGNCQIILCERGIRTFEKWTKNTLDISAVPVLRKETFLPIVVDISHSTGRRDIAIPVAKAALAVGADGIMVEVHNNPNVALSDAQQQLSLEQFKKLMDEITPYLNGHG